MRVRFMLREAIEGSAGQHGGQGSSPRTAGSPRSLAVEDIAANRVDAELHFEMQRAYHERMHKMQLRTSTMQASAASSSSGEPLLSPEHSARGGAASLQPSQPAHRGESPTMAQLGRTSPPP